jgi:hypothetical protein
MENICTNLVETIRKFSQSERWRHFPGLQNPVDLASRGAPAPTLVTSTLWWYDPIWLKEDEREWPDPPNNQNPPTIQSEIEYKSQRNSGHHNSNNPTRMESRENLYLEPTSKTNCLDLTIPIQESREAKTPGPELME